MMRDGGAMRWFAVLMLLGGISAMGCGRDLLAPQGRSVTGSWFSETGSFRVDLKEKGNGKLTGESTSGGDVIFRLRVSGRHEGFKVSFVISDFNTGDPNTEFVGILDPNEGERIDGVFLRLRPTSVINKPSDVTLLRQ